MSNKYYKSYISKLINTIPTTITIKRTTNISDGYGGHTEETDIFTEVVAFYDRKIRIELLSDAGTGYTGSNMTKILAKREADIKQGDYFSNGYIEYKVLHVKPYFDICLQIEVEVVK